MSTQSDPSSDPGTDHAPGCPIGLLASTLILMSQLAAPEAVPAGAAGAQASAESSARRIAHNLRALQQHEAIPPALRQVAGRLVQRWAALVFAAPGKRDAQSGFADITPRPGSLLH